MTNILSPTSTGIRLVNHTDAAERISKVLTEVAVSMFGPTELDVYRRAGLTRHLSNAQLGDIRNGPLVNHTDAAERISKVLTEVAQHVWGYRA